ncbi:arginine--tRNA ligase [Alloacidobacterium dinghuense]|uniref:arginine--tRNA ligase n=1 Tax=Alloacidobacterium dinghuense TaxID=2763107 RepID=A0A7G8BQ28_9BACT|nr:arginine--tRNA ligase [Alloacidobacterium dinghuense]QNI34648.1 arginine--tRNA ligase [Alloacidobacterium dinghuense]
MYLREQKKLLERLRAVLRDKFQVELDTIAIEQPPEIKFGEYALPIAFELARKLKNAPRKIADEIVTELSPLEGFAGFEVAGAGYINARLDRGVAVCDVAAGADVEIAGGGLHSLVEHTSINPNKAAHVGHLRNAILGDTFVRLLRAIGQKVDVQNYIDNTGVQVADVVVGLMHLEGMSLGDVQALMAKLAASGERIDYYCWDLYARVSQWYEENEAQKQARKQVRLDTLHAIEHGGNEESQVGELISTAVLRRHLETMLRLDIEYDLLPRESEILHLHFWNLAFEQLKAKGVLYFETEGKNKGCWVMTRAGAAQTEDAADGPDEDAKVIVRSNGTVTYVGKDIAYHLWKFGLLGRDFGYQKFFEYPNHTCWISADQGEPDHPHFGGAQAIYNVIDSRQSDPQANVIEALRGLGYTDQAAHYTHFSYEMVALTPRCAEELGYEVAEEDRGRPYIEVSGRKGFGVKADDLIDKLIAASRSEVDKRHPELSAEERVQIANEIAIGALRYFMLKYTRNSVIAFDFKDALSFEGETGPYIQYAVVRTRSIFRKGDITAEQAMAEFAGVDASPYLTGEDGDSIWQVWLRAAKTTLLLDQCIATAEPAYLAKHAFQLAQEFSNFYRKHHILTEAYPERKKFLLATAAIAQRELIRSLAWLGISAPEVM